MNHQQVVEKFKCAWDDLWTLVLERPFLLTRSENNVLVYLGHFLLGRFCPELPGADSGWSIFFDTGGAQRAREHDFQHGDTWWRTRCDAVIKRESFGSLDGTDQRGILAELKILRCGIREYGDGEDGESDTEFEDWDKQIGKWASDVGRLRNLTSNDGGERFQGAMCTLYFCRPPLQKKEMLERHADGSEINDWTVRLNYAIGRSLAWIDGVPINQI